jgi:hypothetical protein
MKQLVKQVAKRLHMPCWAFIPAFLVRLIFGKMGKEVLLSSQNVEPKKLLDAGFQFSYPLINEALDELAVRNQSPLMV